MGRKEYRRNHFIPQGFLKNFTDIKGKFFVLDKQARFGNTRIRYIAPKQICYDRDRYIIKVGSKIYHGQESKFYKKFDSEHSITLELLQENDFDWNNCPRETVGNLEFMIPLLYWRSPVSDEDYLKILKLSKGVEDFKISIHSKNENIVIDKSFNKNLLRDENIRKSLRALLAFNVFGKPNPIYDSLEWRLLDRQAKGVNLASDNPIFFFEQPRQLQDFRGALILPVGNGRTLIRINECHSGSYHDSIIQDLIIFDRAQRYVICSDKWYLEKIDKAYKNYRNSLFYGKLDTYIFDKYSNSTD